jgi:hypothetical protein
LKQRGSEVPDVPEFLERHYTLAELAAHWHMSIRTLRDWFSNEPGVVRYGSGKLGKGKKRTYISIRVPESVAKRVYQKMTRATRPAGGGV